MHTLVVSLRSALTEGAPDAGTDWKKKTYRIQPGTGTGETCCTTFWIKFNQVSSAKTALTTRFL